MEIITQPTIDDRGGKKAEQAYCNQQMKMTILIKNDQNPIGVSVRCK